MKRDTSELIRHLAGQGAGVRPLASPWIRAAMWCAASLGYVAALWVFWPRSDLPLPSDRAFIVEQAAALATAITAGWAAFALVVPGRSRNIALVPLAPLALWVGQIGQSCARDWPVVPAVLPHWGCFAVTVFAGLFPAAMIVTMLRRGAPIAPRLTTAVASLAVAGIANFGIRFVHAFDPSFLVLAWHVLAVFGLSAIPTVFANRVFNWRQRTAAAEAAVN